MLNFLSKSADTYDIGISILAASAAVRTLNAAFSSADLSANVAPYYLNSLARILYNGSIADFKSVTAFTTCSLP
jgi:hypothetical protein